MLSYTRVTDQWPKTWQFSYNGKDMLTLLGLPQLADHCCIVVLFTDTHRGIYLERCNLFSTNDDSGSRNSVDLS